MGEGPKPLAGWPTHNWIAVLICVGLGIGVTEAVGAAVRPPLDFWPAFAIKVAAGGAVTILALAVWSLLARRGS